jgi:DNA polymerase III epsilon subunit-like protein
MFSGESLSARKINHQSIKNLKMNKHRILVFDVETTGLLPKVSKVSKGPKDPTVPSELSTEPTLSIELGATAGGTVVPPFGIDLNPYIIQFSFILYNLQTRSIERKHDFYINPPIDIPDKITEITGITKETCLKKGVPIMLALDCFYDCYSMCGAAIAHNMAFDSAMVRIELDRNREEIDRAAHYCFNIFDATFEKTHGIDRFCTMRYGTNICNIMIARNPRTAQVVQTVETTVEVKAPTQYKKWPTLLEFHKHLFKTIPENLHNSIVDVLVCLRCYLKSCKRITIEDAEFKQMIQVVALVE